MEYGEAISWFNELGGSIQIKSSKGLHELSNEIEMLETWSLVNGTWEKIKKLYLQ